MRSPNPRALLAVASFAVLLAAADTYVVVLALPDMMAGVGVGIEAIQRATPIISGFLLGYIAVLPLIGRLADVLDRSRILLACMAIFVVGSTVTALAVELPVLVAGRVVQGLGGGGLVPATLAIVADLWPRERRGTPLGVVGAVQELGAVVGPVLGAAILAFSGWRAIFWANAGLGLVLYAALRLLTRPAGATPVKGDLSRAAQFSGPRDSLAGPPLGAPATESRGTGGGVNRLDSESRRTGVGWAGRWVVPALLALAAVLGGLTLLAPDRLVTDVTLGLPFVPFGESSSRVLTPIGVLTCLVLLAVVVLTARRWWPVIALADGLGAVLIAVALGCLVLTFSTSDPQREVVGPLGYALLPVGVVSLALYLWRHRLAVSPLVPRGVLRGRGTAAFVVSLLVGVALVAVIVDVPLLARLTLTGSQETAAFILLRFLVAVPVGALLGGVLLRRLGEGVVAAVGLAATAAGLVVMSTWGSGSLAATGAATTTLALVGLGLGLALAPVNAAALAAAPEDAHGVASALVVVARMIGMVVGLAVLTAVGLHRYFVTVAALPTPDPAALLDAALIQVRTVFAGGAIAAVLAAVVALTLGLRRPAYVQVASDDLSRT